MAEMTYEELVKKVGDLENIVEEKDKEINKLNITVENQELEINKLRKWIFGPKRESMPKEEHLVEGVQVSIFGEPEDEEIKKQVEEKTEEIIVHRKKKSNKAGIKKSAMETVQKEIVTNELTEEEQVCPECGGKLKKIGTETVRQEIEYVPAKLILKTYVRNVYKCEKCGTDESEKETATIVKDKVPRALLPHSFASSSLATEVIYEKYYMGVPLYRQEKAWDDKGLVLPRSMTSYWCIKLSQYYLEPIYELMWKRMKEENDLQHCDETEMQCNKEKDRKATSKSYMWVAVSGEQEEKKGVMFKYSQSRAGKVAQELYKGYNGVLITDGYQGYNNLEGISRAECWAHARRYFHDSVPLDQNKEMIKSSDGYTGLTYINELFKIEREIASLSNEEKLQKRKEKSEPVLKNFYEWVDLTSRKIITNKKLSDAITYVQNQKENLCKFLEDARIPLTNSRAERAIRPFAVHRKNWLFADSVEGAKANAVYYSLIESAKMNNLNIYKYIKYLLDKLSQMEEAYSDEELEKYLPWSKELPADILNFQGEYKEIEVV